MQLCRHNDVVCLQETWLSTLDSDFLSTIDDAFYAMGVSTMGPASGILRGCPNGGIPILWKKSLHGCKIVELYDKRMMGLTFQNIVRLLLIENVYLPCYTNENIDDFFFYMSKIRSIVDNL